MSVVTPHATVLLEFSRDPLSDATPTWIDITEYLLDVEWSDGKSLDLDEPQAGSMTVRLKNDGRRFEPEYTAGAYYPDVVPLRRFRLSLDGTPEFLGYATSFDVQWPAGTAYSEVVVSCVDGFGLLSLDALDLLDPPSATTYEEVVMADKPFGYWRLNDPPTATKAAAVTGPEGTYKGRALTTIGVPGLIAGDTDTATTFASSAASASLNGRVEVPLTDADHTVGGNSLTVEAWTATTKGIVASGSEGASGYIWTIDVDTLAVANPGALAFFVDTGVSSGVIAEQAATTANDGNTHHIVGTFDNGTARLYLDGVLVATASGASTMESAGANPKMIIGALPVAEGDGMDGTLDEVAIYEHALTAERVLAHYNAGANGLAQQTAGARIATVAASDLWAETSIQTGAHQVQPVMQHGQSKLDEIRAAVKAEMPMAQFFIDGDGDPVYLGWDYRAAAPYNEPAATFGDTTGEIPYRSIEPVYDDAILNEVTVSHEATDQGEASHTETDAASVGEYFHRAHAETGLILVDHDDAIAVAAAILEDHKDPRWRVQSLDLGGNDTTARAQIKTRKLGDCVRVKRRGEGGTPIDVITWIIGRSKRLDRNGHLWATFQTARGFNASLDVWRLGMVGYTELGETAVLG